MKTPANIAKRGAGRRNDLAVSLRDLLIEFRRHVTRRRKRAAMFRDLSQIETHRLASNVIVRLPVIERTHWRTAMIEFRTDVSHDMSTHGGVDMNEMNKTKRKRDTKKRKRPAHGQALEPQLSQSISWKRRVGKVCYYSKRMLLTYRLLRRHQYSKGDGRIGVARYATRRAAASGCAASARCRTAASLIA